MDPVGHRILIRMLTFLPLLWIEDAKLHVEWYFWQA